MKSITVAAAALNTTPKAWDENLDVILGAIEDAKKQRVTLLCLPELCITGYGCEDEFHAPYLAERAIEILVDEIRPATTGIAVTVGLPFCHEGAVYNAVALLANCRLAGLVLKQFLAGDGIHYEPRFFKPWPAGTHQTVEIRGEAVPLGSLMFDFSGIRVGLEICEDAWVGARPGASLARHAVDIILNPSASHFALGKKHTRERLVLEGSRAFNCSYVYANLLGNEAGRAIYDGDCLIASGGRLINRGLRFSYHPWTLTVATIDVEATRVGRYRLTSYKPDLGDTAVWTIQVPFALDHDAGHALAPFTQAEFETQTDLREHEFARAAALGLYDYMRKSGTRGFALSLSGGADSAVCAALVYFMVKFALDSNPAGFYATTLMPAGTPLRNCVRQLLTCAYQASENSGATTLEAARKVAEDIGARFTALNIAPIVDAYEALLKQYLGRPLSWDTDDITRQNLQARVRSPSIWSIANAENLLLLTTSNRSEAAVGYATMDGDTSGSLGPLQGIDKSYLLKWLAWAQKEIPSLLYILKQQPTAELRPAGRKQTDEDDLMPYPILNFIQKCAVIQKRSPRDILQLLTCEFPDYDRAIHFRFLKRYLTLWSRNQWKRERYAPSFHLDDENLDPRSWCRYPILSGGYRKELAELATELGLSA
ncbi:NAD(+) synthase [Nibricoccus sp. IMCC34717]|uniref:NAD(+) synthase n=1 Tax=Nibricoccus sp. IMCC34717 TaxID=3034021 RepID=UPI00384ADE40